MSDTRRRNDKQTVQYTSLSYWLQYGFKISKTRAARMERDQKLLEKGADGKNAKSTTWRFLSAKEDGSGKLNTHDETGSKRRNNRALKRQSSKDTRRIGKQITKKELD